MGLYHLYYATNRNHLGPRWRPKGYGAKFSDDGMENLRFGRVTLEADDLQVASFLNARVGELGQGNGEGLSGYFAVQASTALIEAYRETLQRDKADVLQKNARLGSAAAFADLQDDMQHNSDVLVYIHGFNVSWHRAVGSALALQTMLNNVVGADPTQHVKVVLFTWPSDGMALPFVSYKSDRSEARGSGYAFGRAFLKVRDFLAGLRHDNAALCEQDIHLLCHSMGNYVLQEALARIEQFTPGNALPRIFEHIFLCAADVDDAALEPGHPMGTVQELARSVSVYFNRGDAALVISDFTKGNPERLGSNGAARPQLLHHKIQQIDCSPLVSGLVEHSYYLAGYVNADIRHSIDGVPHDAGKRRRRRIGDRLNQWALRA